MPESRPESRPGTRPTVLLTGGTGVLGRALIDELLPHFRVICLRHRTPVDDPRVREFRADLMEPQLGLPTAEFIRLAAEVEVVLHSAAATNWQWEPDLIRRANLDGTRTMLDLAALADAPFFHMSTAFVANPLASQEQERFPGAAAYLASKTEAEQAVREAPVPGVIMRPSVVMGDSVTGRIAGVQGLTRALGAIVKGQVPVMPGGPDSRIDMVPQDVVARAVGDLIRGGVTGGEYWLTAGSEVLLQTEVIDTCLEFADRYGPRPYPPRLIPLESVHRLLLPLIEGPTFPESLRRRFHTYAELLLVFQRALPFESSLGTPHCGRPVSKEELRRALVRNLVAWAARPGGMRDRQRIPSATTPAGPQQAVQATELAS
ncbi:SDR family oxidoreductase [Streptomyces turgidiscabies]|uniref:Nucleoside-diphosphate-sugar epimerase n=1 Tax=Streptomyces turgidiscabies TaxID=85558 RepID=A0ABU0RXD0_9ACTN|nr:SDR family oxidoreductase [Streptomyces turgidiscabies]MDQ0936641.1 nucleoside-diphosphate-sugar epimerase [Streptomyces turgidiscabies]